MTQPTNEKEATEILRDAIQQFLQNNSKLKNKYDVKIGYNVCYKAKINGYTKDGEAIFEPSLGKKYKYQTDLCILRIEKNNDYEIFIPEIIIEVKFQSYTSHDIITYSEKALNHKELHPYLKYGFIVINPEDKKLQPRFFAHNYGFDFAYLLNLCETDTSIFLKEIIAKILDFNTQESNKEIKGFINQENLL